jgi:putative aldouronate transport system permease protein
MINVAKESRLSLNQGWRPRSRWKKTAILLTMVAPGVIWLILLRYLPMFGVVLAFKNYLIYYKAPGLINNIIHSPWVGLQNFEYLYKSTQTWIMIRNTLGYNIVFIIVGILIPVTFAILLNEITRKRMAKVYQTMMFFPFFLSWVVVSYFLYAFFIPGSGLIVNLQKSLGVPVTDWYGDPRPWPYILLAANEWKNVGYTCIMYLATITGIDSSYFEAARIDGASKWQQVRYITVPFLRPIVIILFIINVGRIFNSDFGLFYTVPMNSGSLIPATQVMDTYVYRALINTGDIGMSTAAGLFQSVVGFVLIMVANAVVNRVDPESAMF